MVMCDCECIFIFYVLTKHEAYKAYKLFSSAFMAQAIYGDFLYIWRLYYIWKQDSFLAIWVFELYMESLENVLWIGSLEAIYIYMESLSIYGKFKRDIWKFLRSLE